MNTVCEKGALIHRVLGSLLADQGTELTQMSNHTAGGKLRVAIPGVVVAGHTLSRKAQVPIWGLSTESMMGCPQGPKKERKKEMGDPRSQHFVLASRDIESVTRRVGRWGFSKVYPWNGRIQP